MKPLVSFLAVLIIWGAGIGASLLLADANTIRMGETTEVTDNKDGEFVPTYTSESSIRDASQRTGQTEAEIALSTIIGLVSGMAALAVAGRSRLTRRLAIVSGAVFALVAISVAGFILVWYARDNEAFVAATGTYRLAFAVATPGVIVTTVLALVAIARSIMTSPADRTEAPRQPAPS